jgi:hypothetical protein
MDYNERKKIWVNIDQLKQEIQTYHKIYDNSKPDLQSWTEYWKYWHDFHAKYKSNNLSTEGFTKSLSLETLLYVAVSHMRGHIHMHRVGPFTKKVEGELDSRNYYFVVSSLADQFKLFEHLLRALGFTEPKSEGNQTQHLPEPMVAAV